MLRRRISSLTCLVALCAALTGLTPRDALSECVQPAPDVVGWWPGDNNADDIAGPNDGTLVGGATFVSPSLVDSAFHFPGGSGDYVRVPNATVLQPAQLTVMTWVRSTGSPGVFRYLVAKGGHFCSFASYALYTGPTGGLFFYVTLGGGSVAVAPPTSPSIWNGAWHHIAGTYDGSAVRLFVDGAQVGGGTVASGSILYGLSPSNDLVFGQFPGTCSLSFGGDLDEVLLFDRALTPAEILASFTAGGSGHCSSPVADAGDDQAVDEGDVVTLDGSGSFDPLSRSLTHAWTQVAGYAVTLNLADPVHPTFEAPLVPQGGETLSFELTVTADGRTSNVDSVDVAVKNVNHTPVADAGDAQVVAEASVVTLDASASFDPDSDALSYDWLQTAGPTVVLSDATAAQPTFTAPFVYSGGAVLSFSVTVDDGESSASDAVDVVVENVNHAPVASAGADQTVNEGSTVVLDGTGSSDPDADGITHAWTQVAGPAVLLSDPTSGSPTFITPPVDPGGETLTFELVVNDGLLDSVADGIVVTVLNVNDPPACGLARPSLAGLWPPNHKLARVDVLGVSDPNDDAVTLTITAVTQDEPVDGDDDGDTSPDAIRQGAAVLLRAERSGAGNGRVYHVSFEATDDDGATCSAGIDVTVPLSRNGVAIDSGQVHDSFDSQ